jgi:hypothetical protein
MKKKIFKIAVLLVIVLTAVLVALSVSIGSIIRKGVETVGPKITKTDMQLAGVNVSFLSGRGELTGFVLGNPEGYKAPSAISVGKASVALKPGSVFSDKIVIRSLRVQAPEITFEGGLKENNLTKILNNVESVTGETSPTEPGQKKEPTSGKEPGQKKIEVDDFLLTGAKVKWVVPGMGGKTINVTLPDIVLKDLGTGEEGITVGELMQKVLGAVTEETIKAVGSAMANLGSEAAEAAKNLGQGTVEGASKTLKNLGGLLQKKGTNN